MHTGTLSGGLRSGSPRGAGTRRRLPVRARTGLRTAVLGAALLVAAVLVALAPCALQAQGGLHLTSLRGESFSEADLARGPTIVVLWASWSPRGQDVVPRVNALNRSWSSKSRVVAVNFQEDRATIERFLGGQSFQVPVLLDEDGAFAKKYAVTSLPGLLVFRDGQKAFGGRLPDDPDRVLSEIFP
jgi:thiol-disulfide isomerase/thioredoxin